MNESLHQEMVSAMRTQFDMKLIDTVRLTDDESRAKSAFWFAVQTGFKYAKTHAKKRERAVRAKSDGADTTSLLSDFELARLANMKENAEKLRGLSLA